MKVVPIVELRKARPILLHISYTCGGCWEEAEYADDGGYACHTCRVFFEAGEETGDAQLYEELYEL